MAILGHVFFAQVLSRQEPGEDEIDEPPGPGK